jgi:hypothetical protein
MAEYFKTKKGYFYKILKNGEKKRISQEEYNKKRKNKKMTGGSGEPIEEGDIMYKDDLVCILKPEVKKGIIVFSEFMQPLKTICLSNNTQEKCVNNARNKFYAFIFYEPYYSRDIDYSTIDTEISSSYGEIDKNFKIFIRVDPNQIFVKNRNIFVKIPHLDPKFLVRDIIYQDDLVCILHPEVKKGIIVFSEFTQPPEIDSLCTEGLKTGQQLQKEGIKFGRGEFHSYIFFRAPYYSRPIDYSSIDTEIDSSFGNQNKNSIVFIRVDPDRTFVFSSEIRVQRPDSISELYKSKKTLTRYLQIIKDNESIKLDFEKEAYNLYSSRKIKTRKPEYPFDTYPIERNSEILVSIPHLTPNLFVICYPQRPLLPSLLTPPPLKRYFPKPIGFPPKIDSIWNPIKGQWISPKYKKWEKDGYPEWFFS